MEATINGMQKWRLAGVTLQEIGYGDVGLDDGWSSCAGVSGSHHDSAGRLLVDTAKFPSLADHLCVAALSRPAGPSRSTQRAGQY